VVSCGLDSSVSGWGQVMGSCEQGNKPLGYIKDGEFLDKLSNYQLLDDSAPWSYMYYVTVVCSMSQPFLRKSMK